MGFFSWFNPRNFLDTYQEWHAFANGFCEVLCPWPARWLISEENAKDIASEYHYYVFGRALGVIAWLIIATIVKAVFF
jgi:hypothetical protein